MIIFQKQKPAGGMFKGRANGWGYPQQVGIPSNSWDTPKNVSKKKCCPIAQPGGQNVRTP